MYSNAGAVHSSSYEHHRHPLNDSKSYGCRLSRDERASDEGLATGRFPKRGGHGDEPTGRTF